MQFSRFQNLQERLLQMVIFFMLVSFILIGFQFGDPFMVGNDALDSLRKQFHRLQEAILWRVLQ